MDRQRSKEIAGRPIGGRHPEGHLRSNADKAMDAVREIVNEGEAIKSEDDSRHGAGGKAMDAVRDVVNEEKE
jgi:hypothetical protein